MARRGAGWLAALGALACGEDVAETLQPRVPAGATAHGMTVRPRPAPGQGLLTARKDFHGNPVRAACSSCHATRANNPGRDAAGVPDSFHAGLTLAHGTLQCGQCHAAPLPGGAWDYDVLHLADGRPVAFDEAMTLCAQCHGPQTRDWRRGSHGGMQGHWDLRRGPRERNQCLHCHDPHAPAFAPMVPAPAPRDRFVLQPRHDGAAGGPDPGGH